MPKGSARRGQCGGYGGHWLVEKSEVAGRPDIPLVICPNCQEELPEEANVCGYCGHRLSDESRPAVSPAGQPPWLWIGLGVVGLVLAVGIFAYLLGRSGSAPGDSAEAAVAAPTATPQSERTN